MNRKKVYLAGPITSNVYVKQWREEAENWFSDNNIDALNPLRGKNFDNIKGMGYQAEGIPCEYWVARDFSDVENSDILLANFLYIPERQCVGTLMELGYAHSLRKPYIVIADNPQFLLHPFITRTAVKTLPSLEEGFEAVRFMLM